MADDAPAPNGGVVDVAASAAAAAAAATATADVADSAAAPDVPADGGGDAPAAAPAAAAADAPAPGDDAAAASAAAAAAAAMPAPPPATPLAAAGPSFATTAPDTGTTAGGETEASGAASAMSVASTRATAGADDDDDDTAASPVVPPSLLSPRVVRVDDGGYGYGYGGGGSGSTIRSSSAAASVRGGPHMRPPSAVSMWSSGAGSAAMSLPEGVEVLNEDEDSVSIDITPTLFARLAMLAAGTGERVVFSPSLARDGSEGRANGGAAAGAAAEATAAPAIRQRAKLTVYDVLDNIRHAGEGTAAETSAFVEKAVSVFRQHLHDYVNPPPGTRKVPQFQARTLGWRTTEEVAALPLPPHARTICEGVVADCPTAAATAAAAAALLREKAAASAAAEAVTAAAAAQRAAKKEKGVDKAQQSLAKFFSFTKKSVPGSGGPAAAGCGNAGDAGESGAGGAGAAGSLGEGGTANSSAGGSFGSGVSGGVGGGGANGGPARVVEAYSRRQAAYPPYDSFFIDLLNGGAGGGGGGVLRYPLATADGGEARPVEACDLRKVIFGERAEDAEEGVDGDEEKDAVLRPSQPFAEVEESVRTVFREECQSLFHDLSQCRGHEVELVLAKDCSVAGGLQFCGAADEPTKGMAAVWPIGESMPRDYAEVEYAGAAAEAEKRLDIDTDDDDDDDDGDHSDGAVSSIDDGSDVASMMEEDSSSSNGADEEELEEAGQTYLEDSSDGEEGARRRVTRYSEKKRDASELIHLAGPLKHCAMSEAGIKARFDNVSLRVANELAPLHACRDVNLLLKDGTGFSDFFTMNVARDFLLRYEASDLAAADAAAAAAAACDADAAAAGKGSSLVTEQLRAVVEAVGGSAAVPGRNPLGNYEACFDDIIADCPDELWAPDVVCHPRTGRRRSEREREERKKKESLWTRELWRELCTAVHHSTHAKAFLVSEFLEKYKDVTKAAVNARITNIASRKSAFWTVRESVLLEHGLTELAKAPPPAQPEKKSGGGTKRKASPRKASPRKASPSKAAEAGDAAGAASPTAAASPAPKKRRVEEEARTPAGGGGGGDEVKKVTTGAGGKKKKRERPLDRKSTSPRVSGVDKRKAMLALGIILSQDIPMGSQSNMADDETTEGDSNMGATQATQATQ